MKIAIMQPTYLPWLGYFDLMRQVDLFVFLDDVQFSKQSWQQRNRIKGPNGLQWLTIPVQQRSGQRIYEVLTDGNLWAKEHRRKLQECYQGAKYYEPYKPAILIDHPESPYLVDALLYSINVLKSVFGIDTPVRHSSELRLGGQRGEKVANICAGLGATEYVSPVGALEYLKEDKHHFDRRNIKISFHDYEHPVYDQLHGPFIPCASAVDYLFNCGRELP